MADAHASFAHVPSAHGVGWIISLLSTGKLASSFAQLAGAAPGASAMQFNRSVVVAAMFSGAQAEITSGSGLAPMVTPQPRTTSRLTTPLMRSLSIQVAIRSY